MKTISFRYCKPSRCWPELESVEIREKNDHNLREQVTPLQLFAARQLSRHYLRQNEERKRTSKNIRLFTGAEFKFRSNNLFTPYQLTHQQVTPSPSATMEPWKQREREIYDSWNNWSTVHFAIDLDMDRNLTPSWINSYFDWLRYKSVSSSFRFRAGFLAALWSLFAVKSGRKYSFLLKDPIGSHTRLGSRVITPQRWFNPSRRSTRAGWLGALKCALWVEWPFQHCWVPHTFSG